MNIFLTVLLPNGNVSPKAMDITEAQRLNLPGSRNIVACSNPGCLTKYEDCPENMWAGQHEKMSTNTIFPLCRHCANLVIAAQQSGQYSADLGNLPPISFTAALSRALRFVRGK